MSDIYLSCRAARHSLFRLKYEAPNLGNLDRILFLAEELLGWTTLSTFSIRSKNSLYYGNFEIPTILAISSMTSFSRGIPTSLICEGSENAVMTNTFAIRSLSGELSRLDLIN